MTPQKTPEKMHQLALISCLICDGVLDKNLIIFENTWENLRVSCGHADIRENSNAQIAQSSTG
jgi:hypothetical protein